MGKIKVTFVVAEDKVNQEDLMDFLQEQEGVSNVKFEQVGQEGVAPIGEVATS